MLNDFYCMKPSFFSKRAARRARRREAVSRHIGSKSRKVGARPRRLASWVRAEAAAPSAGPPRTVGRASALLVLQVGVAQQFLAVVEESPRLPDFQLLQINVMVLFTFHHFLLIQKFVD